MSELNKIDLHLAVDGFTLRINNIDVEIDVHGSCKNKVFWRLLTSTAPYWKIIEGSHKTYVHFEGVLSDNVAKALKALEKIRTLKGKETEKLLKMPLEEMCNKLVLKSFIES